MTSNDLGLNTANRHTPQTGDQSPWGTIDHVTPVAEGIVFVSTPRHGGYYLDHERNATVPFAVRMGSFNSQGVRGWYEEDCDAAIVAVWHQHILPQPDTQLPMAAEMLLGYNPTAHSLACEAGLIES